MSTEAPTAVRTVWAFDPAHTSIEFKVKHMMVTTVKGHFNEVTGHIIGNIEDPTNAEIDVEINAASVNTRNDQRDAHLRSADFLEVETYPKILYKSTRIERVGEDRFKVYGDLTIHGVTREIDLDGTFNGHRQTPYGTDVVGLSAEGSLNRKDFGLTYNMALEAGGWVVGDNLKLDFEIEAIKQG
jgi:polyisoprenoid-binding protein YceI